MSVRYFRATRLFEMLTLAHGDSRYLKIMNQLAKTDVLIIDDWGLEKLSLSQRNDLLEIMEDRHATKSTLVTSQLPSTKWHAYIENATLADVVIDGIRSMLRTAPSPDGATIFSPSDDAPYPTSSA